MKIEIKLIEYYFTCVAKVFSLYKDSVPNSV